MEEWVKRCVRFEMCGKRRLNSNFNVFRGAIFTTEKLLQQGEMRFVQK